MIGDLRRRWLIEQNARLLVAWLRLAGPRAALCIARSLFQHCSCVELEESHAHMTEQVAELATRQTPWAA